MITCVLHKASQRPITPYLRGYGNRGLRTECRHSKCSTHFRIASARSQTVRNTPYHKNLTKEEGNRPCRAQEEVVLVIWSIKPQLPTPVVTKPKIENPMLIKNMPEGWCRFIKFTWSARCLRWERCVCLFRSVPDVGGLVFWHQTRLGSTVHPLGAYRHRKGPGVLSAVR